LFWALLLAAVFLNGIVRAVKVITYGTMTDLLKRRLVSQ
jgi:hypothetical protein